MIMLQLQKVLYKKINSCFDLKDDMEIQIQNSFSLKVNYSDDNKGCYATLESVSCSAENPDMFNIGIEMVGIFSCEGIHEDKDKQLAHVQVYNYLFPYVQSMVADLSVKAGLPPFMLEMARIDLETVDVNH